LAAKRISDIAKEIGVASKLIIQKCVDEGVPPDKVKSHASVVSAGLEAAIREWFSTAVELGEHGGAEGRGDYLTGLPSVLPSVPSYAWPRIEREYAPGTVVTGTVVRLTFDGAFVELESNLIGLLEANELSWTRRIGRLDRVLRVGEKARFVVLSADQKARRLYLSVRRLTENPWDDVIPRLYRVGMVIRGLVTEITSLGVYTELEPDLEGFIPRSELTDRQPVSPYGVVSVGEELDLKIIGVNRDERTIELSLKRARWKDVKPGDPGSTAAFAAMGSIVAALLAPHQRVLAALEAPGERLAALVNRLPRGASRVEVSLPPVRNDLVVRIRSTSGGGLSVHRAAGWSVPTRLSVTRSVLERMREGDAYRSDVEQVGSELFQVLASDSGFKERFYSGLDRATTSDPLRLVLEFACNVDDARRCDAGDHHWETLFDRSTGRFVGVTEEVRLVRRFADIPEQRPAESRPGRLSVGISSPRIASDGSPLPTLALVNELQAFAELAACAHELGVKIDSTYRLGLDNLRETMASAAVFHYSGHGREGALELQHADGRGECLTGEVLMHALMGPVPRIVVLNCCRGSVQSDHAVATAKAFLSRGVPCVVAIAGDLLDTTAVHFVRVLYKSLLSGDDIETSLQRARWYMFGTGVVDWFLPSLWSHAGAPVSLARSPGHERSRSASATAIAQEVYHLRPRVVVLQKIHAHPLVSRLSDGQRAELAARLAERVENGDASQVERAAEEFLADDGEVKNVIDGLPPSNEIAGPVNRAIAAIELDIVPRIRELTESIPELVKAVVTRLSPAVVAEQYVRDWPSPSAEFQETEPLVIPRRDGAPIPLKDFVELVKEDLVLPSDVVRRCVLCLLAGQHLLLVGPPGTGKSTIASNLARAFGYHADVATANPDWTTLDVVGGLFPRTVKDQQGGVQLSYEIRPGHMTQALLNNWRREPGTERWVRRSVAPRGGGELKGAWLIIDELNRAPMDQAFGELFTALVAQELRVPQLGHDGYTSTNLRIPSDFRLIGTANTADKHLLFGLSEALKRRFAFVEIPPHFDASSAEKLVDQVLKRPAMRAATSPGTRGLLLSAASGVLPAFQRMRALYPIGPARALDVLTFAGVQAAVSGHDTVSDDALGAALADQVLPLLENADLKTLDMMAALLDGLVMRHCRERLTAAAESADGMPAELRRALGNLGKYFGSGAAGVEAQVWSEKLVAALQGGRGEWMGLTNAGWIDEPLKPLSVADGLARRLRGAVNDG
jgi:MoxR-like ATPase/predicted RNA-binding protein with RPS1 domain